MPELPFTMPSNSIPSITVRKASVPSGVDHPYDSDLEDDFESPNGNLTFSSPTKRDGWRGLFLDGGLGEWVFGGQRGWPFYVGFIAFWLMAATFGSIILNTFILQTGLYKFPYPMVMAFTQMVLCHFLLLGVASLTRGLSFVLHSAGLPGVVAPFSKQDTGANHSTLKSTQNWLLLRTPGIAGGGIFEFDKLAAKQTLPLAVIYVLKQLLGTICFADAEFSIVVLVQIAVIPLTLVFSTYLNRISYSISIISVSLVATSYLLVTVVRPGTTILPETIFTGITSSIFIALYPVQLQNTYKSLLRTITGPQESITLLGRNHSTEHSGSKEEARASWRLLHYTSLLSILMFIPLVILSGEIKNIARNCYFLTDFFPNFLLVCSGIGLWAVFVGIFLLTKATSPLTTSFVYIPTVLFILTIWSQAEMPPHSSVGAILCWGSCALFIKTRRKEGGGGDRLRS